MTPEERRARKVRRVSKRFVAAHPVTPKVADSLHNGVAYLATLISDPDTSRQERLSP